MMNKPNNDYIATQTEEGFQIVFHDSVKKPINVKFDELQTFIKKINERAISEKTLTLTNEEEVLIRLWQMLLIPEGVKH